MRAKKKNGTVGHTGSTFDSFLEEEGIREEVEAVAVKRVISISNLSIRANPLLHPSQSCNMRPKRKSKKR